MVKLVACLLATATLCMGSNPDNSQKYKMDDISEGVANIHSIPPKKYTKKTIEEERVGKTSNVVVSIFSQKLGHRLLLDFNPNCQ